MKINVISLCDTPGCRQPSMNSDGGSCIDCAVADWYDDMNDYWGMYPEEYFDFKEREAREIPEVYRVHVHFPNKYNHLAF